MSCLLKCKSFLFLGGPHQVLGHKLGKLLARSNAVLLYPRQRSVPQDECKVC